MNYYISLIISWSCYFFLHSLLASLQVKAWASKILGKYFKWYRIIYNVIAIAGLGLLVWLFPKIEEQPLFDVSFRLIWAGLFLGVGGILSIVSLRNYDLAEFSGTQQLYEVSENPDPQTLKTGGMNRYVRHPLYFSLILLLIGYILYSRTLSTVLISSITFIYFWIGAYLEERKLVGEYGQAYRDYRRKVKMLIPFLL